MKNYCGIVPRTPPDGLMGGIEGKLDTHGLIYQVVWVEEGGMAPILEERKPRKYKMVRVRCSACGCEEIFPWVEGTGHKRTGYGFLTMQGEAVEDGDSTLCPMCGSPVLVKKGAKLGRRGWYVTDEESAMSADVLEQGELVLTGWRFELRVHRDGREEIAALPMEGYVFCGGEAAKLTGWRTEYCGNAGYYIRVKNCWNQPKMWSESWGEQGTIYGLTKELVERSNVANCKLVELMEKKGPRGVNPVAYMRLWQEHPNVENLVVTGITEVLIDLMREETGSYKWTENKRGQLKLEEVDWSHAQPGKMLGLNREELRMGIRMGWEAVHWRLYRRAKAAGEILSEEDIYNAHCLGDDEVMNLVGQGPVSKSIRYLLDQIEQCAINPEVDEYIDPGDVLGVEMLLDYWQMCRLIGWDLTDRHIRFPRNLCVAHDEASVEKGRAVAAGLKKLFKEREKELSRFCFEDDGIFIRPAGSQEELNKEGKELSHCVWSYAERHAKGETAIFLIRRKEQPEKSWYTLELDEKKLLVKQNRGKGNCKRTKKVQEFENLWVEWIRAGCKKNRNGEPLLPNRKDWCA